MPEQWICSNIEGIDKINYDFKNVNKSTASYNISVIFFNEKNEKYIPFLIAFLQVEMKFCKCLRNTFIIKIFKVHIIFNVFRTKLDIVALQIRCI